MAALAVLIPAALVLCLSLAPHPATADDPPADEPAPAQASRPEAHEDEADADLSVASEGDPAAVANKVRLKLNINGLGAKGGILEIRPGHKGCSFKPIVLKVNPPRDARVGEPLALPQDIVVVARSLNADRDCTFAITIEEPGQEPKTYRRGLRLDLAEEGRPLPEQTLKCFLSTPSIASSEPEAPAIR
jgi:hypothetical protein